ncbi:MAG: GntR family transcriptional regulator [Geminicoccaceae bacterium]
MSADRQYATEEFAFRATNYARVRDVLRADIINAVFQPGDRLKIAELSTRYAVSANPIREALQQLQGEGLVEMQPNKGARVRALDFDVLHDWIEVREAMEVFFARRFVELASDRDMTRLQLIQDGLETAAASPDMHMVQVKNSEFHTSIHRVSRNREAIAIINKNTNLVRALRLRVGFGDKRLGIIVDQHRALMKAFETKNAEQASTVMHQHVVDAGNDLKDQYEAAMREKFTKSVDGYLSRNKVPKGWRPAFSTDAVD